MPRPEIYVPITGPDRGTAFEDIGTASNMGIVAGVEIRYDMFKERPDIGKLMCAAKLVPPVKKVLFTNMRARECEKGGFEGSDDEWMEIYRQVIGLPKQKRPDMISVGSAYDTIIGGEKQEGIEYVWTHHDWKETPARLEDVLGRGIASPLCPDIVKVAVRANTDADVNRMGDMVRFARRYSTRVVGLPMGPLGVRFRVTGDTYGNEFTFAALDETKVSGPGQPTVDDLVKARKLMQMPLKYDS